MRPPPARLERLPQQYFTGLLARVSAAAADGGEPLVDLGRGNPEVGPPHHVVERLVEAARSPSVHGYPPFRGLPQLRAAIAHRYAAHYGVDLDPEREVAVLPGTKTALVEAALVTAERGSTILLPDPGYPDYYSGAALAGATVVPLPLEAAAGWSPDFGAAPRNGAAAVYLNYPSNPCAVCAPPDTFARAIDYAARTGAAIIHDFAYRDLVFDGRQPESFLAEPGAREVGVELYSMSKSYGMAGWRLGFVVGNAELVERINLLQDHTRAGVFAAVQEAAIAALEGSEDSVAARTETYERRRDRALDVLEGTPVAQIRCEGTFYVWIRLPESTTAERLLVEHRVVVAPGDGFGALGAGWVRLSLAVSDDQLEFGLARLRAALVAG